MEGVIADEQLPGDLIRVLKGNHFLNDGQAGEWVKLVGKQTGSLHKSTEVKSIHIRQAVVVCLESNHLSWLEQNGFTGDCLDVGPQRAFQHKNFDRSGTAIFSGGELNGDGGSRDGSGDGSRLDRGASSPFGNLHQNHALTQLQIAGPTGKRKLGTGTEAGDTFVIKDQLSP